MATSDHPLVRRTGPGGDENSSVVFWTDIFLVLVLAILVLAVIPQAIAFFRSRDDWKGGYILYRFKEAPSDKPIAAVRSGAQSSISTLREKPPTSNALPHVKSLAARFHPITSYLRTPIAVFPGYQLGRIFLLLFYFGVLLFAALFRDSVFKNNVREGNLVAAQLPFLYILATKNNAIGVLLGLGYEKLNYIHRFVGRLVALAANVHALGFIYKWVAAGTWTMKLQDPSNRWGLVALVAIDVAFFFALSPIRQKCHNFFFATHLVALIVLLFAICLHQSFAIPYVAVTAGFYGADRLLRIVKSRTPYAYLTPLPDLGTTRIRIPTLNAGWRSGQYVRIRVLSRNMGWLGWTEAHPYTIASFCEGPDDGEGIILMVKTVGGWSRKVYDVATGIRGGGREEDPFSDERRVRVLVEGPYGGPGYTVFASFSAAMLIAGGSGISFALGTAQELVQRARQGTTNIRIVELIWIVQNPRALNPLLNTFTTLLSQTSSTPLELTIRVHYTRALTLKDEGAYPSPEVLPQGLLLFSDRASIPSLVEDFVNSTSAIIAKDSEGPSSQKQGALVAVCGPAGLGEDARQTISALSAEARGSVGGVQFHEEAFHY